MTALQSKILEIFNEVQRICEQNDLRYYAIYGTCLGAVRHKGFIPWDDDLDIAMPYRDFKVFMEIAPIQLLYPYKLLPIGELQHSSCIFAKVHNTETTFIEEEELRYPESYKGVYIDIFPICGIPDIRWLRKIFWKKFKLITYGYMFSRRKEEAMKSVNRRLYFYCMVNPISKLFSDFWLQALLKLYSQFDFDNSDAVVCCCAPFKISRRKWFDGALDKQFEITNISIPQGYDEHLSMEYGNYMVPPPSNERQSQHSGKGIVDLDMPYSYYQSQYQKGKISLG